MLRELLPFAFATHDPAPVPSNGSTEQCTDVAPLELRKPAPAGFASFEDVYRGAPVKPSKVAYSILKIAEMAESPHLGAMTPEAKRCSLLMALEAAGIALDDLLQDAMIRQRALNDYEETLQKQLKELENSKLQENRQIQSELDRISAEYMARIQTNMDEVARRQDQFRAWQKDKQQEARRITDAAAICVPQNTATNTDSLTLVIERVTGPRR